MKRLKIRGHYWKFILGRPPENNCAGLCDYETRTIWVRPNCGDIEATTIHELLHATLPDFEESAIQEIEDALIIGLNAVCEQSGKH